MSQETNIFVLGLKKKVPNKCLIHMFIPVPSDVWMSSVLSWFFRISFVIPKAYDVLIYFLKKDCSCYNIFLRQTRACNSPILSGALNLFSLVFKILIVNFWKKRFPPTLEFFLYYTACRHVGLMPKQIQIFVSMIPPTIYFWT